MSRYTVYRAVNRANERFNKYFSYDFGKIPQWCEDFTAMNPGSIAQVSRKEDGTFRSVFVAFKPALDAAKHTGLGFMGVDASASAFPLSRQHLKSTPTYAHDYCTAAHMKHKSLKSCQLHVLSTRDGNNQISPIGTYLTAAHESADTHGEFAKKLMEFGAGTW